MKQEILFELEPLPPKHNGMYCTATLSPCRTYRYDLLRQWEPCIEPLIVIGLNPSTADETEDDQTIRKCIGFAQRWGYGGIIMLNLFAYRSRDQSVLKDVADPIGPKNDQYLQEWCMHASGRVLVVWGNGGDLHSRGWDVRRLLEDVCQVQAMCLGKNHNGTPKHPVYLSYETARVPW